jgi:tRNA (adenine57-N1/adenine58-N1)-methyltransferase
MPEKIVRKNDLILLVFDERRRWLIQAKPHEEFHTHRGIIQFNDIIGKQYGTVVFSRPHETQGYKFYILEPLPSDYVILMERRTQIIYPEDAGLILIYTGISPGSKVLEAGCGSGALTCILANYVRPNGHIYSCDINEKSLKRASKNVARASLSEIVSFHFLDITEAELDFRSLDSIVLDMAQPWIAIPRIKNCLRLSGILASFSPTIEQVKKTTFALRDNDFCEIYTYELLKRTMQVKSNATRPQVQMIGHTGYITFGRYIQDERNPYRAKKPLIPEVVSFNGMPLREED